MVEHTMFRWQCQCNVRIKSANDLLVPQLFIQRTLFGKQRRNLTHYQNRLCQAVASVQRYSVPEELWMEDGHLVAFSLMYDVTVFVYNVVSAIWYV